MMSPALQEWLNLILRWSHLIAGVMWIGQTYLFNWMERAFEPPADAKAKPNISGELWMVHGGGFYLVEKQKWPEIMPRTLHWFKWEAMLTFVTGFFLLAVVYWLGAGFLPVDSELSRLQGVLISIGVLVLGVAGYRLLWNSPLGSNEPLGAFVSWLLITALIYGLHQVFTDRAAYLHLGAMFGAIMVANVWLTIIPNQKKIMAITEAGAAPDHSLALAAKRCSRHNTFMSVPLMFTMISNHFPAVTFGCEHGWLILSLLVPVGWAMAFVIREYL